jgi:hypothetical protein
MRWLLPILAGILLVVRVVNADELHLKDGSVVTGTVVGYEEDSFRVKTSWGYAEIRKEQVAQIVIGGSTTDASGAALPATAHKPSAAKKSTGTATPISPSAPAPPAQSSNPAGALPPVKGQLLVRAVVTSPNATPAATENSAAAKLAAAPPAHPRTSSESFAASVGTAPADKLLVSASHPATSPAATPASTPGNSGAPAAGKPATFKAPADRGTSAPATPPASTAKAAKLPTSAAPVQTSVVAAIGADETASPAPKRAKAPPAPEPVREAVSGNEYTNETYGFRMYRPPGWQLDSAARKLMPGAIAALGTADEKTYFFIGLEPAHGALAENLAETDKRLRGIMDNYRAMGDRQVTISGAPGTERRFRGTVDSKDWTGIVAVLPRANQLYTVFGITYADSDLSGQIQENVIRRAIDSLMFAK